MDDFLMQSWDMLIGRTTGPLTPRLFLQPTMAVIFAIRAGLRDAREERTPYLQSLAAEPERRAVQLRLGWGHVRNVFLFAIGLDVVYQLMVFRWVYPLQALIVAVTLAIVPYLLVRGIVTRIARRARGASGQE